MKKVEPGEILDIAQYEKQRADFRRRIIELKKRRRLPVGPVITFVFENHETVFFQIQEMMRAERIVDEAAIQHEIDTYNQLLPEKGEVAATMLIELQDSTRIREEMEKFIGINKGHATYLQIGEERLEGVFDAAQGSDHRISAVQYVRFRLSPSALEAFSKDENAARLVIDHPNYRHSAPISGELREELLKDLNSSD